MWQYELINFPFGIEEVVNDEPRLVIQNQVEHRVQPIQDDKLWNLFDLLKSPSHSKIIKKRFPPFNKR